MSEVRFWRIPENDFDLRVKQAYYEFTTVLASGFALEVLFKALDYLDVCWEESKLRDHDEMSKGIKEAIRLLQEAGQEVTDHKYGAHDELG